MTESSSFHPVLDRDLRTLKAQDAILIEQPSGLFRKESPNGLYWNSCRLIAVSDLRLDGSALVFLDDFLDVPRRVHRSEFTNPEGWSPGDQPINQGAVFISREKQLKPDGMLERITCQSHAFCPLEFQLTWWSEPDFADMFEIRGWLERRKRELTLFRSPSTLTWSYQGDDGISRVVALSFDGERTRVGEGGEVSFPLSLKPGEKVDLDLEWSFQSEPKRYTNDKLSTELPSLISTNSERVNLWLDRAAEDLSMLMTTTREGIIPYAGLPWFAAMFGRDALWVGLATNWLFPDLSAGILESMARTQSRELDPSREAEPGKIIHELRHSERTLAGDLPFDAYYGSVDATSLFLILAHKYYRRTGDEVCLLSIAPAIGLAARWLIEGESLDQNGLLFYSSHNKLGLTHQGWRDAEDAYFNEDGRPVSARLFLVEAQAYRLAALDAYRQLLRVLPDNRGYRSWLDERLDNLRQDFLERYWWPEEGVFYPALDGDLNPLRFLCSAAGHVLWAGLADPERGASAVKELFSEPFWSGWGVRTVAPGSARYNPLSYHNGGVWPHDTAIAAVGAARYGDKEPASAVFHTMGEVAIAHPLTRLPELFSGFQRQEGQRAPLRFSTACSPQAWAVTVPFFLLESLLGLDLDAPTRTVTLNHPVLPGHLTHLEVRGLRIGDQDVSFRITRKEHSYAVHKLTATCSLDLVVRC